MPDESSDRDREPDAAKRELRYPQTAAARPLSARLTKRSDLVAEQIKSWIVAHGLTPGDRLPQEKELIRHFSVSKGTIREALKSLEVQGLVRITTGPQGGAAVARVDIDRSTQLLANYFYFQDLDVQQVYAARKLLEPELAALAVPHMDESHLQALERSVTLCSHPPVDHEMEHRQRMLELDFHDILATICPNPFLAFNCRFMNSLLRDCTVIRDVYGADSPRRSPDRVARLAADGVAAHQQLLAAFRARDAELARTLMRAHIEQAEGHMIALEAVLERRFLDQ
jgi:DNA-binding FadR family transcriptional regulator